MPVQFATVVKHGLSTSGTSRQDLLNKFHDLKITLGDAYGYHDLHRDNHKQNMKTAMESLDSLVLQGIIPLKKDRTAHDMELVYGQSQGNLVESFEDYIALQKDKALIIDKLIEDVRTMEARLKKLPSQLSNKDIAKKMDSDLHAATERFTLAMGKNEMLISQHRKKYFDPFFELLAMTPSCGNRLDSMEEARGLKIGHVRFLNKTGWESYFEVNDNHFFPREDIRGAFQQLAALQSAIHETVHPAPSHQK